MKYVTGILFVGDNLLQSMNLLVEEQQLWYRASVTQLATIVQ
jgi:hypothetical protein